MNKWLKWALGEALARAVNNALGKVIGNIASTLTLTFWASGVIGLVQVVAAMINLRHRRLTIWSSWPEVIKASLYGFIALALTVISFIAFLYGADLGVKSFIFTLSIVPGALIDRFFFNHRLVWRQWLGVGVGLLAGWVILGSPSLREVWVLPLWVWLSIISALLGAASQWITQANRLIDPMRGNFWGGVVALLALPLAFLFPIGAAGWWSWELLKGTVISILMGLVVVVFWAFNVLAYRDGAQIAIKKLVALGSFLILAMVAGVLFFKEPLTAGKVIGIPLYFVAFILMDQGTWEWVVKRFAF